MQLFVYEAMKSQPLHLVNDKKFSSTICDFWFLFFADPINYLEG